MNERIFLAFCVTLLIGGGMGCKPRTASQKIEDKVEDAQHEVEQGMERAKENVEEKTN